MSKRKTLTELGVDLREAFQTQRRRLDMLERFLPITDRSKRERQFIDALETGDEELARKTIRLLIAERNVADAGR